MKIEVVIRDVSSVEVELILIGGPKFGSLRINRGEEHWVFQGLNLKEFAAAMEKLCGEEVEPQIINVRVAPKSFKLEAFDYHGEKRIKVVLDKDPRLPYFEFTGRAFRGFADQYLVKYKPLEGGQSDAVAATT